MATPHGATVDTPHLLIVDDEEGLRTLLCEVMRRAGFVCEHAADAVSALRYLEQNAVDVVVTDIRMPGMSGTDLLRIVREKHEADVVVLTGFASEYSYESIIQDGAADFVQKPCSTVEFTTRIKRVLAQRDLRHARDTAERDLESTLEELREAYLDTIHRLAVATEYKDLDTGSHIVRMGQACAILAEAIGLGESEVDDIRYAAPMHDVGKIGIPDSILLKGGRLTPAEFEVMKTHTTIGAKILEDPKSSILACARQIAISHHENWNGKGYPNGLSKEEIPLVGRITKLVDVFDALLSARPYKRPYPVDVALKIVEKERERHFDPTLVDLLKNNLDDILALRDSGESEQDEGDFEWSERDDRLRLEL